MYLRTALFHVRIAFNLILLRAAQASFTFPVISDIAADILKPLFITVCAITAISFVLSLVLERWLRHVGRLPRNMLRYEKVFAWLAICGAALGGIGLIFLSIFDTKRHENAHRAFLVRGQSLRHHWSGDYA
jgi:Frag1/DRAM/Sfk1 family